MAVRNPVIKNDIYYGNMDDRLANTILNIRKRDKIEGLKHMLFNFPNELIDRSIEEGRSIRDIINEENIDYQQYIGELRDYQTVGTSFMYFSKRSILGDGVGMGKTAEIGALINLLKNKGELTRFLVAVETAALVQTLLELIKFTGLRVIILPSEAPMMRKIITGTDWNTVDGVVMKHSALRSDLLSKWLSLYLDENSKSKIFNTFILDESAVVKNKNTKTHDYTRNICNIVPRVHFLNATPFETHIMDIYNQIDMIDESVLPKKWRIEKEYCKYSKKPYWVTKDGKPTKKFSWNITGYKNQQKFKESLKLYYFARAVKDKPHIYKVYEITPSNNQLVAIDQGNRYTEVLNCPSLIPSINIPTDRKNVPKIERTISLIENEFYDSKVMIYCFYLEAQYALAKELEAIGKKVHVLNGSKTDDERWEIINDFNTGDCDIIITNIKKSLNLFAGEVCILYTMETNPSKAEQITGRIARNVDNSIKTFILLVYHGTDEYRFLMDVVKQRAKYSRELTIDSKTAVDYFMEYMELEEENDEGVS